MKGFWGALDSTGKAIGHATKHFRRFFEKAAGRVVALAHRAFLNMKDAFASLVHGLQNSNWDRILSAIVDHVKKNPKATMLQLICLLVVVCPSPIASLLLLALGFGIAGPVASKSRITFVIGPAAGFQSTFGTPLAFSVLRGATMGGVGMAVVAAIVQIVAVGVFIAVAVYLWQSRDGGKDKVEASLA